MKKTCEHCGSEVKITPVCAKCGRDHSGEWLDMAHQEQYISRVGSLIVVAAVMVIAGLDYLIDFNLGYFMSMLVVSLPLGALTAKWLYLSKTSA